MSLFVPTPTTTESKARVAMRQLLQEMLDERQHRIAIHQRLFAKVWHSNDYTPSEAFEELGEQGERVLSAATLNLENLNALAELEGKSLIDYLAPEDFTPPVEYSIEKGTIKLK